MMAPWFGLKSKYDTGVITWQGWLAVAVFLGLLLAGRQLFHPAVFGLPDWAKQVSSGVLLLGFLILVWCKYERDGAD